MNAQPQNTPTIIDAEPVNAHFEHPYAPTDIIVDDEPVQHVEMQLLHPHDPAPEPPNRHTYLPSSVVAEAHRLRDTRKKVEDLKRQSDGLIGPIGLDSIIGLVPILGAVYSITIIIMLNHHAGRAKCSFATRMQGVFIGILDVVIGALPGPGDLIDAFLRAHSYYASKIIDEIDEKLIALGQAQHIGTQRGYLTNLELTGLQETMTPGSTQEKKPGFITYAVWGFAALVVLSAVVG